MHAPLLGHVGIQPADTGQHQQAKSHQRTGAPRARAQFRFCLTVQGLDLAAQGPTLYVFHPAFIVPPGVSRVQRDAALSGELLTTARSIGASIRDRLLTLTC